MAFRSLIKHYQSLSFLLLACLFPTLANSATDEIIEKRTKVAMRAVGHEVLTCLGDRTSRVLPIQKVNESYKISFESELGFDPGDLITTIDKVMQESQIGIDYFLEVEQCETKEIVYALEMNSMVRAGLAPCEGRVLPLNCYSLLITLMEDHTLAKNSSKDYLINLSEANKTRLLKSVFLILTPLLLIGFIVYSNKKEAKVNDPNLIKIGASIFDKRTMILSYKGHKTLLSHKEAELLSILYTSVNKPVEREVLLQKVWGDEGAYIGRTLDVFISKLRKKTGADTSLKIVNIRGLGYKLVIDNHT